MGTDGCLSMGKESCTSDLESAFGSSLGPHFRPEDVFGDGRHSQARNRKDAETKPLSLMQFNVRRERTITPTDDLAAGTSEEPKSLIEVSPWEGAANMEDSVEPESSEHKQRKRHPHRKSKRLGYLLVGDTFRNSNAQLEPGSCAPGTEGPQWQALRSQVHDIIKPIEYAGYSVSVYGVTYPCLGGQRLVDDIPKFFGGRMHGFTLTNRTNTTYGGQVHGWQRIINDVISDAEHPSDLFDFYVITRWDLRATKPTTPEFWQCALSNSPSVARHLGHLNGYTTKDGWGRFNMDFMMIFPAIRLKQLHSMLMSNPERCCSTVHMSTACTLCAENLNVDSHTAKEAPLTCNMVSGPFDLVKTAPEQKTPEKS